MSKIEERTIEEARFIVLTKNTIRKASEHYGVSKSTLHNDLKYRLPKINKTLYLKVQKILNQHFEEKHIRGGQATKNKLLLLKISKENK